MRVCVITYGTFAHAHAIGCEAQRARAEKATEYTSGMQNIFGERERPNMVPCNFELHVSKKRYSLAL